MSITNESAPSALYRAVWRWHFIAGLLVIPFLVLLAVTGALYLFSNELDHVIYRAWNTVAPDGRSLPTSALVERAQRDTGGQILQITQPDRSDRAVRMLIYVPGAGTRSAFVDPHDGRVLGTTRYGGAMQVVRKLHSLQYFGRAASWLVEAAAGWAIVLVGTGVFLWWPRGRAGALTVRGRPRDRIFWRDLHAVTGVFAGAVVVFLAVTGMPWSDVWGGKVQEWSTNAGMSRPNPPAEVVPDWLLEHFTPTSAASASADAHHHHQPENRSALPWALEKAPEPESDAVEGHAPIGIDEAIQALERAKLPKPYNLTLPQGPKGAFAATYAPDKVEQTRVVYLDRYDARVLDDVGYARFGSAAKIIEWGIAVHQGQQFGPINRYLMLAGCIAIVVLAVTSVAMWWKRRPPRTLGVPPSPPDARVYRGLLAIIVPLAIFYPLVGVSLVVAFAIDGLFVLIRRRVHATR